MKKTAIIISMLAAALSAVASDQVWSVTTNPTNAPLAVTASAKGFAGELLELSVYNPVGSTGVVAFTAVDPYSGQSVALASGPVSTQTVWRPRIAPVAVTGASTITMTNTAGSSDVFMVAGETITAALSGASGTNQEWKFRVKYERK